MEREGILNSGRAGGDWVGGCCTKERDRVDGAQPEEPDTSAGFGAARLQAGQGDRNAPFCRRVGTDEAIRRGNGDPSNEDDDLMMNDSPATEPAWRGLLNNDIYHNCNHGPKYGGGV
ncbi:uncharacterized protein [Lolium perenne]|uniref:uncharacterized protein n=1 Tax=Lolium perenne TaxID=4522 RepID=UPI0021F68604|nr:uncharacterized protein LOC127348526 [Lolium perenne]